MQYAVVDVETTGASNKITEIAIYVYDDQEQRIVESFDSLVNPECNIPPFIVNLTGITNDMVASAPRFFEIAKDVYKITENRVFVAHNVAFDYNVIRQEFKELGADFRRKKACTVRLSRKAFPGFRSYSLGKLCERLDIQINGRHRATGDALATAELLQMILAKDDDGVLQSSILSRNKEGSLPPNLPRETYEKLPDQTGVYYMHDSDGKVIYVGKAKEIRSRISSHFADNSIRKLKFKDEIHDLSFQLTGSELLALLVEAVEIKHHFPKYNRAQKYSGSGYGLCQYEDQNGIIRLEIVKNKKYLREPIASFSNLTRAKSFLKNLAEEHQLCARMVGIQNTTGPCFDFQIGKCRGVCCGNEDVADYNARVTQTIEKYTLQCGTYLVWLRGRNHEEKAYLYIENGLYKGYGFLSAFDQSRQLTDVLDHLIPQKHNIDIQRILNAELQKISQKNIVPLNTDIPLE